jgi:hypothetical protein
LFAGTGPVGGENEPAGDAEQAEPEPTQVAHVVAHVQVPSLCDRRVFDG